MIVHVADLFEAEGRSVVRAARSEGKNLRVHLARMGLAASALAVGAIFVAAGVVLLLGAFFLSIQPLVGTPGAWALTGCLTLAIGALLTWTATKLTR